MSLKCLKIVQNASYYIKSLQFSLNVLKNARIFLKASHHFEKASIPLKLYLKSLAIF
jgi:hypothetical protein